MLCEHGRCLQDLLGSREARILRQAWHLRQPWWHIHIHCERYLRIDRGEGGRDWYLATISRASIGVAYASRVCTLLRALLNTGAASMISQQLVRRVLSSMPGISASFGGTFTYPARSTCESTVEMEEETGIPVHLQRFCWSGIRIHGDHGHHNSLSSRAHPRLSTLCLTYTRQSRPPCVDVVVHERSAAAEITNT